MATTTLVTGSSSGTAVARKLTARRDTLDFRDRMFQTSLVEVPTHIALADYLAWRIPVLDQGEEGACTGFGLATVANYLLQRRKVLPDKVPVSARMLYEMARRYDEWPGEDYSGSSARGAMKGWQKHGVCSEDEWKYEHVTPPPPPGRLTQARTSDALQRPLGAYLRVNHKDLVAMHSALAEVGILYATATVHEGWDEVDGNGDIAWPRPLSGGHAFAVVAYDAGGFWIQNSWSDKWGQRGLARICYDDWLANATDVWVARLGAPVVLRQSSSAAIAHSAAAARSVAYSYAELRPHIVSLGNDGALRPGGDYGTTAEELREIFEVDMPRVMADWPTRHVLLYAHGGLVDERSAVQRMADYRSVMLDACIYPIGFVWHSDYWSTITNILQDAMRRRRPEGALGAAKDFLLDRLDDTLEILARALTGKASWDEMKENALAAGSTPQGGARMALDLLAALRTQMDFKLHVVSHSAGSIFQAPLVRLLTAPASKIASGYLQGQRGYAMPLDTCTLWAPAVTTELFKQAYLPSVEDGSIGRLAVFALSDKAEQDDNCARIYNKSLLYLVSRAFEQSAFGEGTPLLGMEKWLARDPDLSQLFTGGKADLVFSPNSNPEGSITASRSAHHNDFDDDGATLKATLARITGAAPVPAGAPVTAASEFQFQHSGSSLRGRREAVDRGSAPMSA
ncbi:C1 family peptidase [Caenimonas terrae]|uniref:C1 family peptidase n=1 Tax=Caenimonas terrae TaxID=696074 RepID=A0ABW0NET3_9BURK